MGRQASRLPAGIHVDLVVITNVNDVLVALSGAGEGLEANVGAARVAGPVPSTPNDNKVNP